MNCLRKKINDTVSVLSLLFDRLDSYWRSGALTNW